MGGGPTMRAAAKAAGAGILNNGLRMVVVPDHSVYSAARKAARPVRFHQSLSSSTSKNVVETEVTKGVDPEMVVAVQWPCWEFDEWELAGGSEEVVGGASPSIDEVKEATCESKDVLEKGYLSSTMSPHSWHSQSGSLEITPLRSFEKVVAASTPKHAMQAFKFLNESPAVQDVVASIACDPNVWNAVLLNPSLQEYIQSQNIGAFSVDRCENELSGRDILSPRSPRMNDPPFGANEDEESNLSIGIADYLLELKHTAVGMLNNLTDCFHNLFGGYNGENDIKCTMSGFVDRALPPSLLGLALMIIMLVMRKRAQ